MSGPSHAARELKSSESPALLDLADLEVTFELGHNRPPLRAVDRVSLIVGRRETVGIVGESGSGKSTIGRAILGLTAVTSGRITFAGKDITRANVRERRSLAKQLQVVFQDPYSSLNPTRTVGQTLGESLRVVDDQYRTKSLIGERVTTMLEHVGLPSDAASRYPGHFSGGQRQRIAIARALMASPELVICDEPTSALDLSVQAQVLNLLRTLQDEFELSYLFISHDLAVVRHLAHRIVVLYRGRVMEQGEARRVCTNPAHPYTRALLSAAPVPDPDEQRRRRAARAIRSDDTSPSSGAGCPFAPRCHHAVDLCATTRPALETTPDGRLVACHRWPELHVADVENGAPK